jgi:RNA polymerase sigma-70 factor (ECF subfamily)
MSLNGLQEDQMAENIMSGEELHRRFLDGDHSAFEDLVELYEHELALFINAIVHDHHEAKHLVIETFTQLALHGKKFEGRSSLKTYLFTIGKNLAIKYVKNRRKERHISYEDAIETLVNEDETPYHFMEREENKRYLREAMHDLKEEYRIVLELLYFEDMSYIEAGETMKKSVKQVTDLAYRAKASLKKKLESAEFSYF